LTQIAFDPNKPQEQNTTDVLASNSPSNAQQEQSSTQQSGSQTTEGSYVSNGNPYGSYATPGQQGGQTPTSQPQNQQAPSVRRQTSSPSSGLQTNVQDYIQKNQQGSQQLGQAVSGKLQTSADIAKQNLQGVEKNFGQAKEAGSLENYQGAVDEATGAFRQAATMGAGSQRNTTNQAQMYTPDAEKDADLIASNQARVSFGDGTTKDFGTQFEAQRAIDEYNRLNPETNLYGGEQGLNVGEQRLSDILNAQYKGPRELYEARGYGDAVNQFSDVQSLQDLALGSGSKNELLNRTFQTADSEYGVGSRLLDDLLLGQGSANQQLRQTAENLSGQQGGNFSDVLQSSVQGAKGQAKERTQQLDNVKMSARKALDDVATGRDSEVRQRIEGVVQNWDKYPQHFRDKFQGEMAQHEQNIELKKNYQQASKALDSFTGADIKSTGRSSSARERTAQQRANAPLARLTDAKNKMSLIDDALNKLQSGRLDRDTEKVLRENFVFSDPGRGIEAMGSGSITPQSLQKFRNELEQAAAPLEEQYQQLQATQQEFADFKDYNPDTLNFNLSQLEAEALGVQGGEGLYNLIKERGIDGLLQTAQADENQLISRDEQSQLARLQKIAELANDYGASNSGIDFRNKFSDKDLAGQQTALSALDTTGFRDALFGAEKNFQDFAKGANIKGKGTASASSSGLFGSKSASSTKYARQNLGDLLNKTGGFRQIYDEEGVDTEGYNNLAKAAKGIADGTYQSQDFSGLDPANIGSMFGLDESLSRAILNPAFSTGAIFDANSAVFDKTADITSKIFGNNALSDTLNVPANVLSEISKIGSGIVSGVGGSLFGSSEGLQSSADVWAQKKAVEDLKKKITSTLKNQGYANQLGVVQDTERDQELLKLLGLLDTTNL
jgi:hypothetical protein